jgi:hypothetical protein
MASICRVHLLQLMASNFLVIMQRVVLIWWMCILKYPSNSWLLYRILTDQQILIINNAIFNNNNADLPGYGAQLVISSVYNSTASITNSQFSNGQSLKLLSVSESFLLLYNCSFTGNTISINGVYSNVASLVVSHTEFSNNVINDGATLMQMYPMGTEQNYNWDTRNSLECWRILAQTILLLTTKDTSLTL